MNFFSGFFRGIGNCFKGFSVLFSKGLWPFMIYPLVIWLLLYMASIYGIFLMADGIGDWLASLVNVDSIPESGHWLSWARPVLQNLGFIVTWVLKILFWLLSGTLVKYILLIILSPVFALLSEKTEERLTGNNFPFSFKQLMKDIVRGIGMALRNMLLEYFFILISFFVTFLFPPLIFITTPFLLFLGWYFVGFSLIDYNCERHRYSLSRSVQWMRKNKGYACGVGITYSFFLALPFLVGHILGVMIGPAIAVIGGTISFLEINQQMEKAASAAAANPNP